MELRIPNHELKNYEKKSLVMFKTLKENEIALGMICWR